ncbi:MAG: hypothetical protein ACXW24_14600, partial [Telluria sp.]
MDAALRAAAARKRDVDRFGVQALFELGVGEGVTAQADFIAAQDAAALENAKAKYLGKTGQVTELMKGLGKLEPDQKK